MHTKYIVTNVFQKETNFIIMYYVLETWGKIYSNFKRWSALKDEYEEYSTIKSRAGPSSGK